MNDAEGPSLALWASGHASGAIPLPRQPQARRRLVNPKVGLRNGVRHGTGSSFVPLDLVEVAQGPS